MRSILAALAALVLAAIPPAIHASTGFGAVSLLAAMLMLGGLWWTSMLAAATGVALALCAYAAALVASQAPPGVVDAVAIGVALVFVIDAAHAAVSLRGAAMAPGVVAAMGRGQLATALLGGAAAIALAAAASLADFGAPPVLRPVLAGLGGFLALAAALIVVTRHR
jgi:hypothetical protein